MHHLNPQQKILHAQMLTVLLERGAKIGYCHQHGVTVIRVDASTDGAFWPQEPHTFYPPFRYSLDALHIVEKVLTKSELADYANLLREAVIDDSTGIIMTHALAQIASPEKRFDCLCRVFNFFDPVGDETATPEVVVPTTAPFLPAHKETPQAERGFLVASL